MKSFIFLALLALSATSAKAQSLTEYDQGFIKQQLPRNITIATAKGVISSMMFMKIRPFDEQRIWKKYLPNEFSKLKTAKENFARTGTTIAKEEVKLLKAEFDAAKIVKVEEIGKRSLKGLRLRSVRWIGYARVLGAWYFAFDAGTSFIGISIDLYKYGLDAAPMNIDAVEGSEELFR